MKRLQAATLIVLTLGLGAPAKAAPLPRYGLFLFSSLCSDPHGGDIEGAQLVIVRTPHLDQIIFNYGAGGLFGTEVRRLDIQGAKLTAQLTSDEGGVASLQATLSARRVDARLKFDGAAMEQTYRLVRVAAFGRALPSCR